MELWRRTNGNMVMIFALTLVPIVMMIGFGIDTSRQHSAAAALQKAVDGAVLSVGRSFSDPDLTDDQRIQVAKDLVAANYTNRGDAVIDPPVVTFPEDDAIRITVTGSIPATTTGIMGMSTLKISASSAGRFTEPSTLDTVLVLDTTGSMDGTPLADLKTAAKAFAQDLLDSTKPDIKMGIVPFAQYVNVGTGYRSADWINVPADYSTPWSSCSISDSDYTDAGCTCDGYDTVTHTNAETGATTSWTECTSWTCPGTPPTSSCTSGSDDYTWYGCVRSRATPYDIEDTRWDIDAEGFLGKSEFDCPTAITALTNNKGTILSEIDGLSARGWTYIPAGLAWGKRVLSPVAPFDEAMDDTSFAALRGRKLLVLMSDGANTRSLASSGFHTETDVSAANTRTLAACNDIKDDGIDIFVIAFNVTDTDTISMLQSCASTFEHYSAATDLASLTAAFKAAGESVSDIVLFE